MRQTLYRKEEDFMITMEEYLRKKNVIKGKEPEAEDTGQEIHNRGKKEKRGEEKSKLSAAQWSAVMTLAELMYI